MATIKVFDCHGVKELKCFDNFDDSEYDTGFDDGSDLPDFDVDQLDTP